MKSRASRDANKKTTELLLVNPPMALIPPDYPQPGMFTRFIQPAINPGILSIASYAIDRGHTVRIADFSEMGYLTKTIGEIDAFTKQLMRVLEDAQPIVFGVSNTSVFDYIETGIAFRVAKEWNDKTICIAGGQNVSMLGEIALRENPQIDCIVVGEGEYTVCSILERIREGSAFHDVPGVMTRTKTGVHYSRAGSPVDLNTLPVPKFEVYPDFRRYIPFVEESRGCWAACNFCINKPFYGRRVRIKRPEVLERDLANAVKHFGTNRLFAMTTSIFNRTSEPAVTEFCNRVKCYGVHWTTQTRCDTKIGKFLPRLHESGLFLLNLGLESASPKILSDMNKTINPLKYLEMASDTLKAIEDIGTLWTCCNFIFFAGETRRTILGTRSFLVKHRTAISAVVANPLFGYPGSELWLNPQKIINLGGLIFESEYCKRTHHFPVIPSKEFGLNEIGVFSEVLEKVFTPNPILDVELDYRDMEPTFFGEKARDRELVPSVANRVDAFGTD